VITAAVSYYYVLPHGKPDFSKLKGPVLGHFGSADEFVPIEAAKELESEMRAAGADATFHYYEGATHAFFNDVERPERVGMYDPAAAESSWERTVSFLRGAIAGSA
jgi:carboxymethylenebutenolidase